MMLGVALVGFDGPTSSRVAQLLGRLSFGDVSWRVASMAQADAWCVDAHRLIGVDALHLRLQASIGGGEVQVIPRGDLSFPIAVGSLQGRCTAPCALQFIDLSSSEAAFAAFCQFGAQFLPQRSEYALGAILAEQMGQLVAGGIYHLVKDGRLVALVDLGEGIVGNRPGANPAEIRLAKWHKRPQAAGQMPETFLVTRVEHLLRNYASRALTVVLPEAYSTQAIHWRASARYAGGELDTALRAVVELLQTRAMTMAELASRLGWPVDEVARAIQGLDLLGVVSTRPQHLVSKTSKALVRATSLEDEDLLARSATYVGA